MMRPAVLVFAGADPSGGAGIQADNQAIAALGAHPLTVITALTVQDNNHVFSVHPVPVSLLHRQAEALTDQIEIAAVKIGIVANHDNALAIAAIIHQLRQRKPDLPVVLDPVLASGQGNELAVGDAVRAIEPLIPLATLLTPNLPEAAALCNGERRIDTQAAKLLSLGCANVLIKGGHGAADSSVINSWYDAKHHRSWSWPRLSGEFHGSGCTLASAIAALLAHGSSVEQALDQGQAYCQLTLATSYAIADGQRIPNRVPAALRESK